MNKLLRWLLLLLAPHVADADPDPPEGEDDDDGDIQAEGADDAGGTVDEPPEDKPDPVQARVDEALRAAKDANDQVAEMQRQARARPDPSLDEEERKLRDPATSDLEKWQIQSNRALRQSQQQSAQALFQAQDMADRTTYQVKAATNPVYSKYADKVEAELTRARSQGSNVPREMILQVLVGRDMLAGNFKPAAAKPSAKQIPRGKSPGARSDTPSRGGSTEHQKRVARLQDVQI